MPLQCPHCHHNMVVKDAKPGKYKPKCAKCGERFALTVFPDASKEPLTEKLPIEGGTVADSPPPVAAKTMVPNPQIEATMPSPPPVAKTLPTSPISSEKTVGGGIEATAMFDAGEAATMVPGPSAAATIAHRGADATAPGNYGTPIATTTLPTAANPEIISDLINGTKYYFAVKAVWSGVESAYSNEISVTPVDIWSPRTPENLATSTVAQVARKAIITWDKNNDDTVIYKIYYGGISGALRATIDLNKDQCSVDNCSIDINDLNTGAKYYFSITALDVYNNESNKSGEISLIIK